MNFINKERNVRLYDSSLVAIKEILCSVPHIISFGDAIKNKFESKIQRRNFSVISFYRKMRMKNKICFYNVTNNIAVTFQLSLIIKIL